MEKDSSHALTELAVDGGMSNSDLCMQVGVGPCPRGILKADVPITTQTQANIIGIPVDRPAMRETTSLGATIAAGFATDIWKDFSELKKINQNDRKIFEPVISQTESAKMLRKWNRAVEMCRGWVEDEDG
jgi:glycerol kinase